MVIGGRADLLAGVYVFCSTWTIPTDVFLSLKINIAHQGRILSKELCRNHFSSALRGKIGRQRIRSNQNFPVSRWGSR
jgi:hypothetical protein